MKKSLITTSVAILLASTSAATFASSVTIPNTFVAGEPAVAADVNANFDAVATSVNDNFSKVTINTGDIDANRVDIDANRVDIDANGVDIDANRVDIDANATAISALQGGANCPDDMTAVGSICVDTYEASVWDAATDGNPLPVLVDPVGGASAYPCTVDGDDCATPNANAIYARSVPTVTPANWITWYQAAQACANVGKRLPTMAEWQMAALGTPGAPDCNLDSVSGELADTDAFPACLSPAGVVNMVGNVMEMAADIDISGATNDIDDADVPRLGNSYDDFVTGLTTKALSKTSSLTGYGPQTGFRCVK